MGFVPEYKGTQTDSLGCILSAGQTNSMEVQRNIGPQQTNSSSMCESTQRSCEPRRKRMDDRTVPSEMARIITDPATGKCYCRGKVLGKVAQSLN